MRRTMSIGRLSKRITLLQYVDGEDSMGQSIQKLHEVATVWADIYPIRGSEFYELKKIQSKVTHRCLIRYHESYGDIDSNWHLQLGKKIFDVDSVIDIDGEHKMLEIRCYERVNRECHDVEVVTPQEPGEDPQADPETDPEDTSSEVTGNE